MISKTFIIEEHEEYGGLGMRAEDMPKADPIGGMGVAHDIIEHFPRDNGSMEHEFMALGASLYIRDECYYTRKGRVHTDPADHLSGEFRMQADYCQQRGDSMTVREPPRTTKLDEWAEATMDRMFAKAKRDLHDDYVLFLTQQQCRRIRGWFRLGYRKAVRRYNGIDGVSDAQKMQWLFVQIEEDADKRIAHGFEGQRFRLTISPKQGGYKFTELNDDYY